MKQYLLTLMFLFIGAVMYAPEATAQGGGPGPGSLQEKLPVGDWDVFDEDGDDTGVDVELKLDGNKLTSTEPDGTTTNDWDWSPVGDEYVLDPCCNKLEIYPTTDPDVKTFKVINVLGGVIESGTLHKS